MPCNCLFLMSYLKKRNMHINHAIHVLVLNMFQYIIEKFLQYFNALFLFFTTSSFHIGS